MVLLCVSLTIGRLILVFLHQDTVIQHVHNAYVSSNVVSDVMEGGRVGLRSPRSIYSTDRTCVRKCLVRNAGTGMVDGRILLVVGRLYLRAQGANIRASILE